MQVVKDLRLPSSKPIYIGLITLIAWLPFYVFECGLISVLHFVGLLISINIYYFQFLERNLLTNFS